MAYETVTSPILTDATGQDIVDKLDEIAQNLQPPTNIEASDVSYDNTQSGMTATDVQGAVTELKSNLTDLGDLLSAILFVGKGTVSNLNDAQRVAGQITINTFTISASNKPTSSAGGYLFTFANTDSANFGCQVVVNNEGLYGRRIQNGTWQAWTTVKTWT